MQVRQITFVGFGLLASSFASAIKQAALPIRIRAVSAPGTLARARQLGLADEFFDYDSVAEWVSGSDLILLCSPIISIIEMLEKMAAVTPEQKILVSDIGSTKQLICESGAKLPSPFLFVGGHPMAGSEKRSLEFHDPALFENAYWFLCPDENTPESVYAPLTELIQMLGSEPVLLSAKRHDAVMAWLSHMPQMVSSTLAGNLPPRLAEKNDQHFAGRGFRDMTRIAASSWNMWHDILKTNHREILTAFSEFADSVESTKNALKHFLKDEESVHDIFSRGNAGRASLFTPGRNLGSKFFEITVQLADKPGTIISVLQPLAEAGLNVRDIELMKVRENIAGTLLLAFKTQNEAEKALEVLAHLGFKADARQ
ncbi:MAG: prephenate dehydrogenase/arogenate dehydrogenase family protein [Fibrobacter sp.]|jgi:prephenate dehydrogenase|nr:prephenate dehydrogenase/arogenate dehydrogenase family protein [Fibrobacter sp.]